MRCVYYLPTILCFQFPSSGFLCFALPQCAHNWLDVSTDADRRRCLGYHRPVCLICPIVPRRVSLSCGVVFFCMDFFMHPCIHSYWMLSSSDLLVSIWKLTVGFLCCSLYGFNFAVCEVSHSHRTGSEFSQCLTAISLNQTKTVDGFRLTQTAKKSRRKKAKMHTTCERGNYFNREKKRFNFFWAVETIMKNTKKAKENHVINYIGDKLKHVKKVKLNPQTQRWIAFFFFGGF